MSNKIDFSKLTKAEALQLPEAEYDAYLDYMESRPTKKANGRKTLLPVFLLEIYAANRGRHLEKKQSIEILDRDYGLSVERKALGRYQALLEQEGYGEDSVIPGFLAA